MRLIVGSLIVRGRRCLTQGPHPPVCGDRGRPSLAAYLQEASDARPVDRQDCSTRVSDWIAERATNARTLSKTCRIRVIGKTT